MSDRVLPIHEIEREIFRYLRGLSKAERAKFLKELKKIK